MLLPWLPMAKPIRSGLTTNSSWKDDTNCLELCAHRRATFHSIAANLRIELKLFTKNQHVIHVFFKCHGADNCNLDNTPQRICRREKLTSRCFVASWLRDISSSLVLMFRRCMSLSKDTRFTVVSLVDFNKNSVVNIQQTGPLPCQQLTHQKETRTTITSSLVSGE